jgi:threonine dehydrogenase-like Zn-dependent dehydrogenase
MRAAIFHEPRNRTREHLGDRQLLDDVLAERINPGRVLDYETDLEGIADAYAAMDERRAIKSLVRVGTL